MGDHNEKAIIKRIIPNGDCALIIQIESNHQCLRIIHALANDFLNAPMPNMINVIPASESLALVFNQPIEHDADWHIKLQHRIDQLTIDDHGILLHEIPVCYEPSIAPDLIPVCEQIGLTLSELINTHTKPLYEVTNLGFLPGFAYLSGNDKRLNLPRKNTPSISVEAGSIAIANGQTGLYALSSSGGWHVIGRTPLTLLNWNNSPANFIKPLDQVRLIAIDLKTFERMSQLHEH